MILEKSSAGYSLSPGGPKINHRLYMDDLKLYGKTQEELEELITVTHSFSADICMEFGIEKCATLRIEGGKKKEGIGVTLPSGEVLKDLTEEGYSLQIPRDPRVRCHPPQRNEDTSISRVL